MSKKLLWPALSLAGVLLLAAVLFGPSYALSGTVTGAPVAGGREASTDSLGSFTLAGVHGVGGPWRSPYEVVKRRPGRCARAHEHPHPPPAAGL